VLTGTAVVDHSIAGRSQLFSLGSLNWDDTLCELFNVDLSCLPPLVPTLHDFGKVNIDKNNIPLLCIVGDQQSALMGQGFSNPKMVSINLGTSGSVQCYTGNNEMFINGLLSNLLWSSNLKHYFLVEGTINACNSLFYWLEDHLNIPHKKMKWDERCEKTKTGGILVPDFTGIASPYWVQPKETVFYKLNNTTKDEIIRAGMESIGFFVHDIMQTLKKDGFEITSIQSAGGGARKPLLQFMADLLDIPVKRSKLKDKTALGVFRLLFRNQFGEFPEITHSFQENFVPKMTADQRKIKLDNWAKALIVAGVKTGQN
jgi:glycerol kinase